MRNEGEVIAEDSDGPAVIIGIDFANAPTFIRLDIKETTIFLGQDSALSLANRLIHYAKEIGRKRK